MILKDVLNHLKQAEEILSNQIEYEERKEGSERPRMYTFTYQQYYDDSPDTGPNYQCVQTHSLMQAFSTFANVIEKMKLRVFNICYHERYAHDEIEKIGKYWKEHRHKEKQSGVIDE